tara:strand:- start:44379 stop:45302 length:924 start_codon:yes stop_codon:yes gene_type:complete
MRFTLSLALALFYQLAEAQDTIPYIIDDEEYLIHNGMDENRKAEFIEAIDAIDVEVSQFTDVEFPVRITYEGGKQNLLRCGEIEFISENHLDSIAFITKESREVGLTFGSLNSQDKFIFTSSWWQDISRKKDTWDEIEWRNLDQYERGIKDMEYGEPYGNFPIAEFYVKKDGKWGVVGLTESYGLQVFVPTIFDNKDEIEMEYWSKGYTPDLHLIRKKFKADLIEPLPYHDDLYLIRNRKNKKWGVVREGDKYERIIKPKYDSLVSIENQSIIILWTDSYVGLSTEKGEMLYESPYDNYKMINLDYM